MHKAKSYSALCLCLYLYFILYSWIEYIVLNDKIEVMYVIHVSLIQHSKCIVFIQLDITRCCLQINFNHINLWEQTLHYTTTQFNQISRKSDSNSILYNIFDPIASYIRLGLLFFDRVFVTYNLISLKRSNEYQRKKNRFPY